MTNQLLKYMDHMLDPLVHPYAPAPGNGNDYSGLVKGEDIRGECVITVGTSGYGYLVVDPSTGAACSDRAIGLTSLSGNTATANTQIPANPVATVSETVYPIGTKYVGANLLSTNAGGFHLLSQVNACAVYVKPISSVLDQNGMMYLLETPEHSKTDITNNQMTLIQAQEHRRARPLSATMLNPNEYQSVLNFHRQDDERSPDVSNARGASAWIAPQGAATNVRFASLIVVVTGTPGTQYNAQIRGSWNLKGLLPDAQVPRLSNPIGSAAFYNVCLRKRISGWSGKTDVVRKLFFTALRIEVRKLMCGHDTLEKEKAKAVVTDEGGGLGPTLWRAAKHLAPLALDALGIAI